MPVLKLQAATAPAIQLIRWLRWQRLNVPYRLRRPHPLFPPPWVHVVGLGDYMAVGDEFFGYFRQLCRLEPSDRVLDVGCGTGRMARPLTKFLTTGSYNGFDIIKVSIEWCQRAYRRFPAFTFHHADIRNQEYNPNGAVKAFEYRFPAVDSSIDFAFLTSVFTHMLTKDMDHYVAELRRVLATKGRCLVTFFLLNNDARRQIQTGQSDFAFEFAGDGYCYNGHPPETAVAYEESDVRALFHRHGLTIRDLRYGKWCGRPDGLSWQDLLIAQK
jgi:SAM-dependent methyltransferase